MKENKKPIKKIILAFLLVVVIGIGIYGTVISLKDTIEHKRKVDKYLNNETTEKLELSEKTKEFSCKGFSITLPEDFEAEEDSEITLKCVSEGIEVFVFEDKFDANAKELRMTAEEYLQSLAEQDNSIRLSEVDGIPCAEYAFIGEDSGVFRMYKVLCYKGADSFWLVHFITEKEYTDRYAPYISEWIKTIEAE